jgi:ribosome modulation factor
VLIAMIPHQRQQQRERWMLHEHSEDGKRRATCPWLAPAQKRSHLCGDPIQ